MYIDEYNAAKNALLHAFNLLAPNGKVQATMVSIVHAMEKAGDSQEAVLAAIAHATTDGLDYGNWPTA